MIRWVVLFIVVGLMTWKLFAIYDAVFPDFAEQPRLADGDVACINLPAKVASELKFYRVELCDGQLTMLHPIAYGDLQQ